MIGIPSSDKKQRIRKDGQPYKPPKKGEERKPHEQFCQRCLSLKPVPGFRKRFGRWNCAECTDAIDKAAEQAAREVAINEK